MAFATNAGTRIFWTEQGAGEPILLIMGHRWTHEMWHQVAPELAKTHRVVMFDNRGVGESDKPSGPYTAAQMAGDALAVLDAAGIDRAHIYGASMGGQIAQEVALLAPERVISLILGCTAAGTPDKFPRRQQLVAWPAYWMNPSEARLAKMVKGNIYGPAATAEGIAADLAVFSRQKNDRRGLIAQAHAVFDFDSLDRVGQITAPTLVLHGDHDRNVPLAWGQELADAIPNARIEVLPGSGHLYMTGGSRQANEAVISFVDSVRSK
ncbi:MAG: dienelactone hydrolase family protein [Microbacteriaceae bacterium]|nr:dienelactone hydrolase family protein [Microbacteriaceae bacterium]